jgi:hypothetical protein
MPRATRPPRIRGNGDAAQESSSLGEMPEVLAAARSSPLCW